MSDEYTERFKRIKYLSTSKGKEEVRRKKEAKRVFREGYRHSRKEIKDMYSNEQIRRFRGYANDILDSEDRGISDFDAGKVASLAKLYMQRGEKKLSPNLTLKGAKLYERIGKGNLPSVKNRLLRSYKKYVESRDNYSPDTMSHTEEDIRDFLVRNSTESQKGLEGKFVAVIGLSLAGIAGVFFLSPNSTGNVIGNLSVTTSNTVAGILLFFVILGVVYFLRKEKNKPFTVSKKIISRRKVKKE